jgi:ribonuclease P protein component
VVCYWLDAESERALFGVVVSKQVGGAVVRNLVRRRLQAICAEYAVHARADQLIVLRALPGSRDASWDTLRSEVTNVLGRAVQAA